MRKNSIHLRVNWGDTDQARIVYYPNFFKWFDIAGHQFFRVCDLAPSKLERENQIILPVLDVRCTFENAILYEDIIEIHTEVEEVNRKTIKLRHQMIKGEKRMATGYEVRGWVRQTEDDIKAQIIPDHIKDILKEDKSTSDLDKNPLFNA